MARFFFVADPDGYQIEVIERGGRFAMTAGLASKQESKQARRNATQ